MHVRLPLLVVIAAVAACGDDDVASDGATGTTVYASRSGCSTEVRITEVRDCGDETEVHYLVNSDGPCAAFYDGWDAVVIRDGSPVTFIGHE